MNNFESRAKEKRSQKNSKPRVKEEQSINSKIKIENLKKRKKIQKKEKKENNKKKSFFCFQ